MLPEECGRMVAVDMPWEDEEWLFLSLIVDA